MFRLACVLLLLHLTYQLVRATDAQSVHKREEASSTCVDGSPKRSLFDIIWGCASTTIICAWAAVHPNIPPRESPLKKTLRRLELMLWTIVAPEILPCWALNQLLAAMTARDIYNEGKGYRKESWEIWKTVKQSVSLYEFRDGRREAWTLRHGHFLIMGGFHLVEPVEEGSSASTAENIQSTSTVPQIDASNADAEKVASSEEDGRVTILTLEMLRELVKDPEFKIRITEDAITDKSKGDALSKSIFILQTSWFIIQCIARRVQGFDLTQLELTTLALASLNGITFILWWHKPLGAQAPVHMYLKRKLTDTERNTERGGGKSYRAAYLSELQVGVIDMLTTIRDTLLCRPKENILIAWFLQLPLYILGFLVLPIVTFVVVFIFTLYDLLLTFSFAADATHVPTFYVPMPQYYEFSHAPLLLILGSLFGGIHCAGWYFPFPTYVEQKLWRIASLAVTIIPIGGVVAGFIIANVILLFFAIVRFMKLYPLGSGVNAGRVAGGVTIPLCILMYMAARVVLLGLALELLRNQPPSAYLAVDWTRFYPHVL